MHLQFPRRIFSILHCHSYSHHSCSTAAGSCQSLQSLLPRATALHSQGRLQCLGQECLTQRLIPKGNRRGSHLVICPNPPDVELAKHSQDTRSCRPVDPNVSSMKWWAEMICSHFPAKKGCPAFISTRKTHLFFNWRPFNGLLKTRESCVSPSPSACPQRSSEAASGGSSLSS